MTDPFERAVTAEQTRRRERRVRSTRIGFVYHLAVFTAVNILLAVVWTMNGGGSPWFLYVTVGWGIGLVAHAVAALTARSA